MNLKTIRLAQRDIEEAAAYYRSQRAGLDEEFLSEVEQAVSAIAATSYSSSNFALACGDICWIGFPMASTAECAKPIGLRSSS